MEYYIAQIGARIRVLRQKRGLTQKSLAGTYMTRNMLSLIENGQASPSIATIVYLAERLNAPAGYFFAFTYEDEKWYYKMMLFPQIKALYRAENYAECILRIQEIPRSDRDDEIQFIYAHSLFQTAIQFASLYALKSACDYLTQASDVIQDTIYAGNDLKLAVQYYKELISFIAATGGYSSQTADISNASSYVPIDMLRYFTGIQAYIDNPNGFIPEDWNVHSLHNTHLQALALIACNQFEQAAVLLNELLNDISLPFYMRYRVCSDLEECANAVGDFRSAYTAARKKLELMECAKT